MQTIRFATFVAVPVLLSACAGLGNQPPKEDPVERRLAQIEAANEARVARLEELVKSQNSLNLLEQVDRLQQELRELRGQLEQQNFEIEGIRRRQRDLYRDLDQRLQRLEKRGGVAAAASGSAGADTGTAPVAAIGGGDPRTSYDSAFGLLKQGKYQKAVTAFEGFVQAHPKTSYSDNAQYWLGEANYVLRKFDKALIEFNKLPANYPKSPKVPDALLKIGYIYYETKQWEQARRALELVRARYSDSTAARLAEQRLQRMKREGR